MNDIALLDVDLPPTLAGTFVQDVPAPGRSWCIAHGTETWCGREAAGEFWTTGIMPSSKVCLDCIAAEVPDIHSPAWAGYGRTLDDVRVAPPNARNVTPR